LASGLYRRISGNDDGDGRAQMSSWHSAAATKCGSTGACPAGLIDPTSTMDPILIAGGAYSLNNFHTLTDGQHIIATYYSAANGNRAWQGMVVSSMSDASVAAGYGWNLMYGFYDASHQQIDRGVNLATTNAFFTATQVPQSIGGGTIPDGVPIIVTRF
jgi:hypothetical protein